MKRTLCSVVVLACVLLGPVAALAQSDGATGIEGHVFNRNDGRPVKNAIVTYAEVFLVPGDGSISSSQPTNDSGFFQIETVPLVDESIPDPTRYLHVICDNGGFPVTSGVILYSNLRGTVYRRNIYLDLPAGIDDCLVVSGG